MHHVGPIGREFTRLNHLFSLQQAKLQLVMDQQVKQSNQLAMGQLILIQ